MVSLTKKTVNIFFKLVYKNCYYEAVRLHSNKPVLSALVMYTFCTKNVQNSTAKLIFY